MIFASLFAGFLSQVAPFSILSLYPFSNQLRFSKRKTIILTSILLLFLAIIFAAISFQLYGKSQPGQELFKSINTIFMLLLIPCMLFHLYMVTSIWQKKMFIFSFSLMSALMITSICNFIAAFTLQNKVSIGLPYQNGTLYILLLAAVISVPILIALLKISYLPMEDGLSLKENTYLSIMFLVLFLLVAGGLASFEYNNLYDSLSLFLFFALIASVCVTYIMTFKMLHFAHAKLEIERETAQIKSLLSLHDEQYKRITENIEIAKRMRHDLRHHMVAIQGLLHDGQINQAEQYVTSHMNAIKDFEVSKMCSNDVINAVVSHYKAIALENNIDFKARIDIQPEIGISDADISVLLGNLLENAIEAVKTVEGVNRFINLNIICHRKMLAITQDNGFNAKRKHDGNHYISTKKGHSGIGINSIEHIAKKYDGGVEFDHQEGVFRSSVMLRRNMPIQNSQ